MIISRLPDATPLFPYGKLLWPKQEKGRAGSKKRKANASQYLPNLPPLQYLSNTGFLRIRKISGLTTPIRIGSLQLDESGIASSGASQKNDAAEPMDQSQQHKQRPITDTPPTALAPHPLLERKRRRLSDGNYSVAQKKTCLSPPLSPSRPGLHPL